ncbi:hypothetical protein EUGRSUZ_I01875 [Eucalyptus grandis]|uniref:Uncharacterized protein n=2 Tax=Eucalyptus grandis TaxID=71139 RepID=A0ACC3JJF7_EUCGR|nr:hypothetical protein EUGRSUZ_I01875 [Eucalyptus grandis]
MGEDFSGWGSGILRRQPGGRRRRGSWLGAEGRMRREKPATLDLRRGAPTDLFPPSLSLPSALPIFPDPTRPGFTTSRLISRLPIVFRHVNH